MFFLLAATKVLVLAALFAVLFGGDVPARGGLVREAPHQAGARGDHRRRSSSSCSAIAIGALIVYSVVKQVPTIDAKLNAAWADIQKSLKSTSVSQDQVDKVKTSLQTLAKNAASGLAGTAVDLIGDVGEPHLRHLHQPQHPRLGADPGAQAGPGGHRSGWGRCRRPSPTRSSPTAPGSSAATSYGSTLVGLFNGAVIGVGALIIGVPMAGTIVIVGWFTNYIPFFGAIISGAFAVLIALGPGGPSKAIPMLIIVIISNGYLQTIVSQFALGSALKLHPLAVLFATTAGSVLFGAVGGVFAAPFLKIVLDARLKMKAAGLFGAVPAASGRRPPTGAGPPGEPSGSATGRDLSAQGPARAGPRSSSVHQRGAGGKPPAPLVRSGSPLVGVAPQRSLSTRRARRRRVTVERRAGLHGRGRGASAKRLRRVLDGLRQDPARIDGGDVRAVVEGVRVAVERGELGVVQQVEAVACRAGCRGTS